jgi:23S rRNA pseudouridine2605 synthase
MAEQRLQKFLASAGITSRRKAEELITSGRVKVNGAVVTELGTKIDASQDLVVVDGKPVDRREQQRYVLLYKPPGCVTTLSDPQGRRTAVDYLAGVGERVFPVGRLDYDAEGAVLFTTDGELANRLAHPRYGHRRVYLVKVKGDSPGEEGKLETAILRMRSGLRLEDGPAQALEADVHEHTDKNVWLRIVVGEGRYHLVKRLCEAVGLLVLRLFRPEFGGISVEGLRPGRWRDLSADEVRSMKQMVGLGKSGEATGESPVRRALPKPGRRHGHGAPLPGGGSAPRRPVVPPDTDEFPETGAAEAPRPRGPRRAGERTSEGGRGGERRGGERTVEGRGGERRGGKPSGEAHGGERRGGERRDGGRGGASEHRGAAGQRRGPGGEQRRSAAPRRAPADAPRGTGARPGGAGRSETHRTPGKRRPPTRRPQR